MVYFIIILYFRGMSILPTSIRIMFKNITKISVFTNPIYCSTIVNDFYYYSKSWYSEKGIIKKDVSREGQAILTKWEKTGLLEGLNDSRTRQNMSVLLENQAKELLREVSTMAAGDVEGFAAVAFPIVRRVFGGLLANDLVSVQPMSLPSGLIFFLDFKYDDTVERGGAYEEASVYGGGVLGAALVTLVTPILPYALAFAAGAMIYVVVDQLIPESLAGPSQNKQQTLAFMGGFGLMMIMDVALG